MKIKQAKPKYLKPSQLRALAVERRKERGFTFKDVAEIVGNKTGKSPSRQAVSQSFKEDGESTKQLKIVVNFLHATGTVFAYDEESRPLPFFRVEV
jgi:transposase